MTRRAFLACLPAAAGAAAAAFRAQSSAPAFAQVVIPFREFYARIEISGAVIRASRDCPPGVMWGLQAADWVNDGTYRDSYAGIDRMPLRFDGTRYLLNDGWLPS